MRICPNCGVEVDEHLSRCPLCKVSLADEDEESNGEPEPEEIGPVTVSNARRWLWEVVSLVALTVALIVFASDFAFGFTLSWSRFPLSAVVFVWISATILITLSGKPLAIFVALTAAVATFLYALNQFTPQHDWFLPLALPLTLLVAFLAALVYLIATRARLSVLPVIAYVILALGVLLLGLELLLRAYRNMAPTVSWSLVAFACALSLFFLIHFINHRLRDRHLEYRKIFHI